jgi:cytosine/adenosine deaminase-related metal-dependent hydrolase
VTRVLAADWVVPVGAAPLHGGAVAYDDGVIVAVGGRDEVLVAHPDAEVEDLGAAILLPALVNAHAHLENATWAGLGDGLDFGAWIGDLLQRRTRLQPGDADAAARLGAELALRSGTGTVADASYSGAAVGALGDAGLRGVVLLEAFGGPAADPAVVVGGLVDRLKAFRAVAAPLVELGVSPHSPYTVAPPVFRELDALARREGLLVMAHVAESPAELEVIAEGTGPLADAFASWMEMAAMGRHPIDLLADHGLLHGGLIAVHVVQADERHVALLAEAGVAVAHCPRSNALLGCGIAPVAAMRRAGVPVGLGTDSPASAIDFDLWAEMRAALVASRAREAAADALTAGDVLRMATVDGARILGLGDRVGSLEPGLRADLTALDLAGSPLAPVDDPEVAAVLGGSSERVLLTVVDGVVRYRRSADAERVAALVAAAAPGRARLIGQDG